MFCRLITRDIVYWVAAELDDGLKIILCKGSEQCELSGVAKGGLFMVVRLL